MSNLDKGELNQKQPDPTAEDKLPHTKVTDDILKVIDDGDSNRYQVALRMTAYVEAYTTNKIKEELESLINNQNEWRGGHGYRAITLEVLKERIKELKALNHRKDD